MKKFPLLITLLFICSCSYEDMGNDDKDDIYNPSDYVDFKVSENAVLLTVDQANNINIDENGELIIPISLYDELSLHDGSVIICPICANFPTGFLVKIVEILEMPTGYLLMTESAMLQQAFEELKVKSSIDMSQYVDNMIDDNGEITNPELVTSDVWNEFLRSSEDTTFTVPTKASGNADLSIKFPVKTGCLDGYVFTDFNLSVDIDITKGRLNKLNIDLNKQIGLAGSLGISTESDYKVTLVENELNFKPFLIPGTPIVIKPSIYLEDTFETKGKVEMQSDLRFMSENQIYSISCNGEDVTFDSHNGGTDGNYIKFEYLNSEVDMNLSATCGCKFAFFDDDLLAFGVEGCANQNLHLQTEIKMDNNSLLVINPKVDVVPTLEASIYCESMLFGLVDLGEDGKIAYNWDFGLSSYTLSTLPQFMNVQKNKAGRSLTISSEVEDKCLLKCSEEGFALFQVGDEKPLVHLSINTNNKTKSVISDQVIFTLPDSDKNYIVRSYAVADDKYYYGPYKRLKRVFEDGYLVESYEYDRTGKLSKIISNRITDITYTSDDQIIFERKNAEYPISIFTHDLIQTGIGAYDGSTWHMTYYDNGLLNTHTHVYLYIYEWKNGNVVKTIDHRSDYIGDPFVYEYEYGDEPNMMNIDWISECTFEMPYLYIYAIGDAFVKNLPIQAKCVYTGFLEDCERIEKVTVVRTYEYQFDSDGYVIKMTKTRKSTSSSQNDSDSEVLIFEYENS